MKKKAVLGNLTTIFPVLIIVVIIMAAYILISSALALSSSSEIKNFETQNSGEILIKPVQFSVDGKTQEILLLDLIALERKGKVGRGEISKSLQSQMAENSCVILHVGSELGNLAMFDYKKENGEIKIIPAIINYENSLVTTKIKIQHSNGEVYEHQIKSYYGECL